MRKGIFSLFFGLLLLITYQTGLHAQSPQLLFESANKDYLEGRYDSAIGKYQQILDRDFISGEVHFNLGNAYYKKNAFGRAILHYERAKRFLGNDEALERNLKLARVHIVDKIEPVPQLFLIEWWHFLLNMISIEAYAWLGVAIFFVFSLFVALEILYRGYFKKMIWTTGMIFIFVLIVFLSNVYISESTAYGIIIDQNVSIVSEPAEEGNELFILHEGTKVLIERVSGEWYEIRLADGKTGWLKSGSLEII